MLSGDNRIRFSLEICLEKGKQCEIWGEMRKKKRRNRKENIALQLGFEDSTHER